MNDHKDIPGIMSPIPISHLEKMHKQNHVWKYWEHEGYELRACSMCGMVEAKGPGGWSEVP